MAVGGVGQGKTSSDRKLDFRKNFGAQDVAEFVDGRLARIQAAGPRLLSYPTRPATFRRRLSRDRYSDLVHESQLR